MAPILTSADPRTSRVLGHPAGAAMYNLSCGLHTKEFKNFGAWMADYVLPLVEGPEKSSIHLLRGTAGKEMLSHYISAVLDPGTGKTKTTYIGEDFDPDSLKKGRFVPELLPLASSPTGIANVYLNGGYGMRFTTELGDFSFATFQLPMVRMENQMMALPLLGQNGMLGVWSIYGPSLRLIGSELTGPEMVQQTLAVLAAAARTVSDKLGQGIDPLTGVMTRSEYPRHVMSMITMARMGIIPDVSVIMIDLDHFKSYNDKYGHSRGDVVLSTSAGVFLDNIRRSTNIVEIERRKDFDSKEFVPDVVGRAGGEEFVIVTPVGLREAAVMAERIRARLAATRIHLPDYPDPVNITGSFGVASLKTAVCLDEGPKADMERLIGASDAMTYRSKHDGRNRVSVHEPC